MLLPSSRSDAGFLFSAKAAPAFVKRCGHNAGRKE
jgi:hypothetical protein